MDGEGDGAVPGWYPDLAAEGSFRYWNGICWTGWTETTLSMLPSPPGARSSEPSAPIDPMEAFSVAGASARAKAAELKAAAPPRGFFSRLFGGPGEDRNWIVGAVGEELVAKGLTKLSQPPWTVLHDLPIGSSGANIDHLVIGPAGVFALNTKNLKGRVWVGGGTFLQNGAHRPYIPAANREARQVASRLFRATSLDIDVRGVVVVIADELTVKRQPDNVHVVGRRHLVRWLSRQPARLGPDHIVRLGTAARSRSTWM